MKKVLIAIILFVCMRTMLVSADFMNSNHYYYFGAVWCVNCVQTEAYFDEAKTFEKFSIEKYEIRENPEDLEKLQSFLRQMDIPLSSIGTPFMVIEDENQHLSFLMGAKSIISHFQALEEGKQVVTMQGQELAWERQDLDQLAVHNPWKFIMIMVPLAFADAINPCAFAVMLLLLSTILTKSKSRKKTILAGVLFSLSIFLSYFLIGVGIFKFLGGAEETIWLKWIVGMIGIFVGLANIKDYFWYGEGFLMEVPRSWRPTMMKVIQAVISPWGAFGVGLLVSLFLLPCSAGPYITILGLLSSENVGLSGIGMGYLSLYNLIFILPMLFITLLVGSGQASVETLAKMKNKNTKGMHLIIGVLMLLLGAYVIATIYFPTLAG